MKTHHRTMRPVMGLPCYDVIKPWNRQNLSLNILPLVRCSDFAACEKVAKKVSPTAKAQIHKTLNGKEESKYIGEFFLKPASQFSEQLIYGLIANRNNCESDLPIKKVKGAISLFYLTCDDGNMGLYHDNLIKMYLYLSRLQWERGYHDEAFDSLEQL